MSPFGSFLALRFTPPRQPHRPARGKVESAVANKIKVTSQSAAIFVTFMLLSGCGGNSSSNSPPTASVPPTALPPTPPVPAPVVPFTFDGSFDVPAVAGFSFRQFSFVDSFGFNGIAYDQMLPLASPTVPRFIWAQPAQRLRLEYIGPATEYGSTQIQQTGNYRIFTDESTRVVVGWLSPTQYVALASWSRLIGPVQRMGQAGNEAQAFWALVGNQSTIQSDLTSSLRYEGAAVIVPSDVQISRLQFTVAPRLPGDNRVSGVLLLSATEAGANVSRASLVFEGTFNIVTNRFAGQITDATGGYTGTFEGAVFGPGREEVGISFNFSRSRDGGKVYAGVAIGTRFIL